MMRSAPQLMPWHMPPGPEATRFYRLSIVAAVPIALVEFPLRILPRLCLFAVTHPRTFFRIPRRFISFIEYRAATLRGVRIP